MAFSIHGHWLCICTQKRQLLVPIERGNIFSKVGSGKFFALADRNDKLVWRFDVTDEFLVSHEFLLTRHTLVFARKVPRFDVTQQWRLHWETSAKDAGPQSAKRKLGTTSWRRLVPKNDDKYVTTWYGWKWSEIGQLDGVRETLNFLFSVIRNKRIALTAPPPTCCKSCKYRGFPEVFQCECFSRGLLWHDTSAKNVYKLRITSQRHQSRSCPWHLLETIAVYVSNPQANVDTISWNFWWPLHRSSPRHNMCTYLHTFHTTGATQEQTNQLDSQKRFAPPPHHHQSLYWPWTLFHRIDRNSLLEGESFCFWEPHNQRKRRPCSVFFCAFSCHWLFWTLFRTLKWHHVLWLKSKATDRKSNCSKRSHEFEATLKKLTITHVLAFCAVIRVLVPSQQPFSFELPITQVARLIVIRGVFENLVTFELGWLHKLLTTGVTLKLSKIWKDIPTSNHVKEIDPSQKNKSVWILLVEWFFFVCKASPSFVLKWESQWPQ